MNEQLINGKSAFEFSYKGEIYYGQIWYHPYSNLPGGCRKFSCWKKIQTMSKFLWWSWSSVDYEQIGICFVSENEYDKIFTYISGQLFFYPKPLQSLCEKLFQEIVNEKERLMEGKERLNNIAIVNSTVNIPA